MVDSMSELKDGMSFIVCFAQFSNFCAKVIAFLHISKKNVQFFLS